MKDNDEGIVSTIYQTSWLIIKQIDQLKISKLDFSAAISIIFNNKADLPSTFTLIPM